MPDLSFYWHDYETFGRVPRRDRPSQFAGVRTNAELDEIEAPLVRYCQPAPDYLPEPEACLLTGILPQTCLAQGVPEYLFAADIEAQLARPGTIALGYNSIRFDDEVTRHLFWRCLMDPYAREWQEGCGRWDLLDVVRCAYALRPGGIEWPLNAEGRPSFRLEDLTRANRLVHGQAHDALSDVRATIALARLIRTRQPRLWDFCLRLRGKEAVKQEIATAQAAGQPLLHVSGMYPAERGCIALVWPLAPHPTNRNELIVWDLANDPSELFDLDAETIRLRMYTRTDELPEGVTRLPIKTIHLNKAPVVIGNLRTLDGPTAAKWGIDIELGRSRAAIAAARGRLLDGIWPAVFERPPRETPYDVDEDLYGALVSDGDRRTLQRLRTLAPGELASRRPDFADARLAELLFRYRARNFPATLSDAERAQWQEHCAHRLHDGAGGAFTLQAYFDRIDALQESVEDAGDERGSEILGALVDYASEIAPERD